MPQAKKVIVRNRMNDAAQDRTPSVGTGHAGSAARTDSSTDRSLGWRIRDAHRLFAAALGPSLGGTVPNLGHWYYLRVLWDEDGLTQQALSQRVGVSPTTAVPAIDAMERNGLVVRARHPTDRRKLNIFLTPRARALKNELLPVALALNERAVADIDPSDVAVFFRVLDSIRANLERDVATSVLAIDAEPDQTVLKGHRASRIQTTARRAPGPRARRKV